MNEASSFRLITPDAKHRDSYLRGLGELQGEGWIWYADHNLDKIAEDFDEYLRQVASMVNFNEGNNVPETEYWGLLGDEFAGRISIRHQLTEDLREVGGHIGYDVVPRFRGMGVATMMLRAALPIAKSLGITRALLTTTEENQASARVIEKNGGVLTERRQLMGGRVLKRYYWIDL